MAEEMKNKSEPEKDDKINTDNPEEILSSSETVEETLMNNETSENITENEVTESELSETGNENTVQKITIGQRINSIQDAVASFIADNNVMARFIGLFMMFASYVFLRNYNDEPRIKPFDRNNGDVWKDYSNSVSFIKMAIFICIIFIGISVLRHFVPKLKKVNIDGYVLVSGVMTFGICLLWRQDDPSLSFGMIAVSLILFSCFLKSDEFEELKKYNEKNKLILKT